MILGDSDGLRTWGHWGGNFLGPQETKIFPLSPQIQNHFCNFVLMDILTVFIVISNIAYLNQVLKF